jgi:deoxyribodipyrimidine photo-lyase
VCTLEEVPVGHDRDFFLYTALKEGSRLERPEGLSAHKREWQHDQEGFERWCKGQTGFPFVDACMRELAATGYMSNRGRQNVANFLSKVLTLDV